MSIAVVQTKSNPPASSPNTLFASTSSPSVTLTSAPTTGNHLIAVLNITAGSTVTAPSGFTIIVNEPGTHSVGPVVIAWATAAGHPSATVTFTLSGGAQVGDLTVFEVSGLAASPVDVATSFERTSAGTSISKTTAALASAIEFLVAGIRTGGSDGGNLTWTSGGLTTDFDGFGGGTGHVILSSSSAVTVAASWASSAFATIGIASFKGASVGLPKVWNGAAWVTKPVKVWNGSAWVAKPVKYWNGSAWVTLP